jgi:4-amino-4-deoxychorismate lyase
MTTQREIVVTLDGRLVEAGQPLVSAGDPMAARGEGVFETMLLRGGRACLLDAHLDRLARSSALIGVPRPAPSRWRSAVAVACANWTGTDDAVLRLVSGRSTGFVAVSVLPGRVLVSRRDGVSAMTLDRGVTAVGGATGPWSMAGAKSLSYAVNAAALRHAEGRGFGDVVLMSADGFVLEGPRSTVVIVDGDGALVTPPTSMPILPGTTVDAVFAVARARGMDCGERPLRLPDLRAAQGVWLLSSVTLAARVHTVDGVALAAASKAVDMAALVDEAVTPTD